MVFERSNSNSASFHHLNLYGFAIICNHKVLVHTARPFAAFTLALEPRTLVMFVEVIRGFNLVHTHLATRTPIWAVLERKCADQSQNKQLKPNFKETLKEREPPHIYEKQLRCCILTRNCVWTSYYGT